MLGYAKMCALIVQKSFGYEGKVEFQVSEDQDFLTDNPRRRCTYLSYSQKKLGFHPQLSTEEGIYRFLTFLTEYREQLEEEWTW